MFRVQFCRYHFIASISFEHSDTNRPPFIMNFFITKSLWVICIIAFVCADVAFGQFGFESNRGFSAQNMNLNQNRNGFGVFAFGGQSTTSNFNQQNFNGENEFSSCIVPGDQSLSVYLIILFDRSNAFWIFPGARERNESDR